MDAHESFNILLEKQLKERLMWVKWCPTMDLAALVVTSRLLIHRLSWEELFSIPIDGVEVTALEWSPDGKIVVLGFSSGSISMFSMENGEEIHTCSKHNGYSVTCLNWVAADEANHLNSTSYSKAFTLSGDDKSSAPQKKSIQIESDFEPDSAGELSWIDDVSLKTPDTTNKLFVPLPAPPTANMLPLANKKSKTTNTTSVTRPPIFLNLNLPVGLHISFLVATFASPTISKLNVSGIFA
eukprot:447600_1